jgi:hypothetical protein
MRQGLSDKIMYSIFYSNINNYNAIRKGLRKTCLIFRDAYDDMSKWFTSDDDIFDPPV